LGKTPAESDVDKPAKPLAPAPAAGQKKAAGEKKARAPKGM
jgi:hypothetical protein